MISVLMYTNMQLANEALIYADNISYDDEKNLIAKGNVKIFSDDKIIQSDLIIYKKESKKYILPLEFSLKDEKGNYYYGSSGEFLSNLEDGIINDLKLLLNDGSRIVGKKAIKKNQIDIISKATYTPCSSRINIKNFICPIWQMEGEKILHDNENLFLYQKHSKLRIFNLPVWYLPYIVTPSPLRKKRKSGFLTPSINFNFFDTQVSQSTSFPYYFNIDIDKELTFTPIFNYGGGVDSSQRILLDYNQLLSGGNLKLNYSMDTKLENQNNENWFKDASIIAKYNQNLNETYNLTIDTALQTSTKYLQTTDPNNKLSYATSLSTSLNLNGYRIRNENDILKLNLSTYQVLQNSEDNKTTPTVLPFLTYKTGNKLYQNINYENSFQIYNIFRDTSTTDHAQKQRKISHLINTDREYYKLKSKLNIKTEFHSQIFDTENKKIGDNNITGTYNRVFPIVGLFIETPMKHIKTNVNITPKIIFISSSGQSNTNKISNEDSTNNIFTIDNQNELNRYIGTDKLDNSKRIGYGFNITKNKISLNFLQNYEFTKNSNYHKQLKNNDYLSDALIDFTYDSEYNDLRYDIRYDPDQKNLKRQILTLENNNLFSDITLTYLDEKKEVNSVLENANETINYSFESKKFKKFSKLYFNGSYDLISDQDKEYKIGYSYFDECFGINLDFKRNFYIDGDLKPQDILTLMFSFKNLGAYKSTNLAVSEQAKQDIQWENYSINNDQFE